MDFKAYKNAIRYKYKSNNRVDGFRITFIINNRRDKKCDVGLKFKNNKI